MNIAHSVDVVRLEPDRFINLDFRDAPLRDVIYKISEKTGVGFSFSYAVKERVSWSWRGGTSEIISTFEKVLSGFGYVLVQESPSYFIIKKIGLGGIDLNRNGYGVFPLEWSTAESIVLVVKSVFGDSLVVTPVDESVFIAGGSALVRAVGVLIQKIDVPIKGDFEILPIKNISVKQAVKFLNEMFSRVMKDENRSVGLKVISDYWNSAVVVRGSANDRLLARGLILKIDVLKEKAEKILWLHNLPSEEAVSIVDDLSEGVYVKKFGANGLLLSGQADEVVRIAGVIARVDGSHVQIRVQATIAQLSDSAFQELGLSVRGKSHVLNSSLNGGGFDLLKVPGSGLLIDFLKGDFSGAVKASENESRGEILSSPVITVLNGQTGRILVGQNVPFLGEAKETELGRETRVVNRENVGVSLEITASEEREGIVLLKIKQMVSSVAPETVGAVDLITDTKEIETTVLVATGETIFLGGLRSEVEGFRVERVPILGWIPLLGRLFTFKTSNSETRHLVVSLRPEIIQNGIVK